MRRSLSGLALLSVGLAAAPAPAAHITDKLAVGLYASAHDEEPERILTSGTPLEVLERGARLCRVRMGNGHEGWLECRYLSDEKPARAMLVEAQARNGLLRAEMQDLMAELGAARRDAADLRRRLVATELLLGRQAEAVSETAAPMLRKEPGGQVSGVAGEGWVAALAGLGAGLLLGALGLYLRCRMRYGGLEI